MRRGIVFLVIFGIWVSMIHGAEAEERDDFRHTMTLFKKMESRTKVPWYYFAAINQYEKNLRNTREDLPDAKDPVAVYFSQRKWVGLMNPDYNDKNPVTIELYGGIGLDGNHDGRVERNNLKDVLYTLGNYLKSFGLNEEDIKIALWERYQRGETIAIIMGYAKIYKKFNKLKLDKNAFPLPLEANYTINNT
ncbi:MAG TPA: peptidase M23, partial [Bacillales bacterium]